MRDSKEKIFDYGVIRCLAPDVFVLDGTWTNRFARRMTVVRTPRGLWVHNAMRLRSEDYPKLEELGAVAWIVAPNAFHCSEAHVYKARYPAARLLVSPLAKAKVERQCPVDGPASEYVDACLESHDVAGTRWLGETVFFHVPSRTLIVTDLVFNMRCEVVGMERLFYRWNRIDQRFGPSRIFRYLFARDPAKVGESLARILEWNPQRVIMNHGEVLETGGHEALRRGFEEIGILPR